MAHVAMSRQLIYYVLQHTNNILPPKEGNLGGKLLRLMRIVHFK